MSQLNVDTIKNRLGTGGPTTPSLTVTNGVNVTGVVTATSFEGSGEKLTGLPTRFNELDGMLFG
jgi:hypothetical protein